MFSPISGGSVQNLETIREIFYLHFQDLLSVLKQNIENKNNKIHVILRFYHNSIPSHTHAHSLMYVCVKGLPVATIID